MGMTGKMWAYEHLDIIPDVITFGKKAQVCGILANKEKLDEVEHHVFKESSRINSTFGGNFIDVLRFQLVMEVIEKENLVENSRIVGEFLLNGLQQLEQKFPDHIFAARGKGLMCAFDLKDGESREWLRKALYDEGIIILTCGDQSLRFRPHLNVTKEEIQIILDKINSIFENLI